LISVHRKLTLRDIDAAGEVHADVLPADFLDFPVNGDAVGLQPGDVWVGIHGVESARGVPGGSCRELFAFNQYDIRPAQLGQVIQQCGTHDATANHDNLGMFFHFIPP